MKMNDVFELPVEVGRTFDDYSCMNVDGLVLLQGQANFGAHAINCHDKLVSEMERYLPLIEYIENNHSDIWAEALHGVATGNGYRHAIKTAKGE